MDKVNKKLSANAAISPNSSPSAGASPLPPERLRLDQRIILLLWRILGVLPVVGIILFAWFGAYYSTYARLYDPRLHNRMEFYAQLLKLNSKTFINEYNPLIDDFKSKNFQYYKFCTRDLQETPGLVNSLADQKELDTFKGLVSTLANFEDSSTPEFRAARKALDRPLQRWCDEPPSVPKNLLEMLKLRFTKDDFIQYGVDVANPTRDLSNYRKEANVFRSHNDMFKSMRDFREAGSLQLAPWEMISFFDEIRADLNSRMPWIAGALLLATGLFLKLRLRDFERLKDLPGGPRIEHKKGGVFVWSEGPNTKIQEISLFRYRWLTWAIIFSEVLFLFMELVLNTPNQRLEWIINIPIMMLLGVAIPVMCATLWDLSHATLNGNMGRYSTKFQLGRLKSFGIGCVALAPACGFTFWYSVVILSRTVPQTMRGVTQGIISVLLLVIMVLVLKHLNDELNRVNKGAQKVSQQEEDRVTQEPPEVLDFKQGLVDLIATSSVQLVSLPFLAKILHT